MMGAARRPARPEYRYFWLDPDGRRGPFCRSLCAAVVSAVSRYHSSSDGTVKVQVCVTIALHLWPELEAEGWTLLRGTRR
jgi:hypothetical protein